MRKYFQRRRLPPPELPETTVEAMRVVANAPIFNANDEQHLAGAAYRADAIARGVEQRREEGTDPHPEYDQIFGEAMSHAWKLFGAGKWTRDDVFNLEARLMGR